MIECLIDICKGGNNMEHEKTDLTIDNKINGYLTTLTDPLKPVKIEILYTGNNYSKTLSLKIDKMMITVDYDELKKKVGDVNE
jgi:hypothetical protein